MILFMILVVIVAVLRILRQPAKSARLLYTQGQLVDNFAVFSCGCRFNWSNAGEAPKICAAHKAIIDSEVAR